MNPINDNNYKEESQIIAEQFEKLRLELNKYANTDSNLSKNKKVLEISRKLDKLHLKYLRYKQ
jgi:hypothetical protein